MATIDNLLNSGRERPGNLGVHEVNNQSLTRSKPAHYRILKSLVQSTQWQRMQAVNEFLSPLLKLIRITFPPQKVGQISRSEAQSYIMRNALAGEYPDVYVDKSKALLSRGPLPVPVNATVTAGSDGLLIEWENDAEAETRHPKDNLVVMALPAEAGQADYLFTTVRRTEGRFLWTPSLPDGPVALWIAFRSPGQTEMSDSVWAGEEEV